MKASRPRRHETWNRPPSRLRSWPRTGATSSGPGRSRSRSATRHLRQVLVRAARAWLRHDARQRAAPRPPVVAPGRRDHARRDRGRAARVHHAPGRRRGRDGHHPQPQGDAVQGRARQDRTRVRLDKQGEGVVTAGDIALVDGVDLPQPEPPHLHAVQGRQARDGADDRAPVAATSPADRHSTRAADRHDRRSTRCSRRSAR